MTDPPSVKKPKLDAPSVQCLLSPQCLHQLHPEFNFSSPLGSQDALCLLQDLDPSPLDERQAGASDYEVEDP